MSAPAASAGGGERIGTTEMTENVNDDTIGADLIALRRRLHRIPEVGLDLPLTQAALLEELRGLPVTITTGRGFSWLAVAIEGAAPGPTVLLRSDMDALPVVEETGLEYASDNGAMHACGHDLHMAALVGAIRVLCARRDELAGTVLAVFQPGEEGYDGASLMIQEGVLELTGSRPVASYGMHVFSFLPAGEFSCRPGTIMAGTLNFELEVIGKGGHAARPAGARNPLIVASLVVQAIQGYATQNNRTDDPIIATVGSLVGGTAPNVIPERALLRISLRALTRERLSRLFEDVVGLARSIAEGYGQEIAVSAGPQLPPTVSSDGEDAFVEGAVLDLFGPGRYRSLPVAEMISEDFSYFLEATGGAFLFLGAAVPTTGEAPATNHSPVVRFDDSVVADGALLLAELALRRLASGGPADVPGAG